MVKIWNVMLPELTGSKMRRAYIYLPESYDKAPLRRYPVMYMFDGHNVFFDDHATYGKSWGMKEFMDRTGKQLIIVAVECNQEGWERLNEYCPYDFEAGELGAIRGRGKAYMDWTVEVLKPYIDENYRTLADREHTAICGSSMGGLMALYAAACYNRVFRLAACLSPSLWTDREKILKLVRQSRMGADTVIYMDYGSEELHNHGDSPRGLKEMCEALLERDVKLTFRIVPGGEHCEASWEKQIPIFMECLGL